MRRTVWLSLAPLALAACSERRAASDVDQTEEHRARARLGPATTIDVPAMAPEIVALSADRRWLLHNDATSRTIEIYRVDWPASAAAPALTPLDFDPNDEGPQGRGFEHEPTCVAAHPSSPIAFATEIGASPDARGALHALDLRDRGAGAVLWSEPVGFHPDNVAISRDGRWLVVANEGETDGIDAPGSVSVIDLRGVDPLARDPATALRAVELDVSSGLAQSALAVEPEYVAIDPMGRFAVVTCQENDALVAIDLRGDQPIVADAKLVLPRGSEPDGVAVLEAWSDPKLGGGALVALAEEGREEGGEWLGQALSLHWLGPEPELARFETLARVRLDDVVSTKKQELSPEAVALVREGERVFALVAVERLHRVLLFDVTDARAPRLLDQVEVGKRPEGLLLARREQRLFAITGDEGKDGPGEISFVEVLTR